MAVTIFLCIYECFVPWLFSKKNDFLNGFVTLCQEIRNNFNAAFDDLLEYCQDTYIRSFRQNVPLRNPLFSISL